MLRAACCVLRAACFGFRADGTRTPTRRARGRAVAAPSPDACARSVRELDKCLKKAACCVLRAACTPKKAQKTPKNPKKPQNPSYNNIYIYTPKSPKNPENAQKYHFLAKFNHILSRETQKTRNFPEIRVPPHPTRP